MWRCFLVLAVVGLVLLVVGLVLLALVVVLGYWIGHSRKAKSS